MLITLILVYLAVAYAFYVRRNYRLTKQILPELVARNTRVFTPDHLSRHGLHCTHYSYIVCYKCKPFLPKEMRQETDHPHAYSNKVYGTHKLRLALDYYRSILIYVNKHRAIKTPDRWDKMIEQYSPHIQKQKQEKLQADINRRERELGMEVTRWSS